MKTILRGWLCVTLMAVSLGASFATQAQQAGVAINLDISAQPLVDALNDLAHQAGLQLLLDADAAAQSATAPRVTGMLTPEAALRRLLAHSELRYEFIDARTVAIRGAKASDAQAALHKISDLVGRDLGAPVGNERITEQMRIARVTRMEQETPAKVAAGGTTASDQEVVVTGSHIRGAETASPVQRHTREEIERSGYATTQEFLFSLPQFSAAGSSEASAKNRTRSAAMGRNYEFATSANIRGLGPQATLTLIDGHRVAPSAQGTSVDLSAIPLSMVDRVEVMLDGGSAIYGSDAVGGVVNIILRDRLKGSETTIEYGSMTNSANGQWRLSQALGTDWSSGSAFASFDYFDQQALAALDARVSAPGLAVLGDLTPDTTTKSVFTALNQRLGGFDARLTGHFVQRDSTGFNNPSAIPNQGSFSVNENEQFTLAANLAHDLGADWSANLSLAYGAVRTDSDTLLERDPTYHSRTKNSSHTTEGSLIANGSLFQLPGGAVKSAIGASYRREEADFFYGANFGSSLYNGPISVKSLFTEFNVPLSQTLIATAAGRHDRYDVYGNSTTPKFGLRWRATEDLTLRTTAGRAFRAPPVVESQSPSVAYIYNLPDASQPGGIRRSLLLVGGNLDVGPERSTSTTFGFDYRLPFARSVDVSMNFFQIKYKDRLDRPSPDWGQMLANPQVYAPFLTFNPTAQQIQDTIARQTLFINIAGGSPLTTTVIVDDRTQNIATTRLNGADFIVRHGAELRGGRFNQSLNIQYILDYKQRLIAGNPEVEFIDTLYNQTDWRVRYDAAWSLGALTLSGAANFRDSYVNNAVNPNAQISSYLTVDARASYRFGFWGGVETSLAVMNALNTAAPVFFDSIFNAYNFDSVNSSPRGRFVTLQLRKTW